MQYCTCTSTVPVGRKEGRKEGRRRRNISVSLLPGIVSYRCWRRICIVLDRYGTIWYRMVWHDVNKCTVSRYDIYYYCAVSLLGGGVEEGCILVLGGVGGGGT